MTQPLSNSERVADDVLAFLICAARAGLRLDAPGMVKGLALAVELYERHPSEVHGPRSEIRKLLAFIRQASAVHQRFDYPDEELLDLARRTELLRKPLH